MVYVMHVTAAQAIASSSTLQNRDALLKQIAAGKHLTTLAFSEKGSRSQFWAPVSKLVESGQGYTTSADKSWVTSAAFADSYVSSAQKPDAASPLESTVYLARKGASGMRIADRFDGLGLRGNDSAPVVIDKMTVAKSDLISAPGEGAKTMLEVVLPWFALGSSAMANGLCSASVGATARHLQETGFDHTGTKLRDLANLRMRLAQMSVRTDQSRALTGYTIGEMEQPSATTPLYVLEMRHAAMEAAVEVTDLAMKTCGGAAFSKHLPVERLFRDARAGWVMAPTVDHLQDFIGKALTGLPLFG
jgi:alkylation response protein AidB-like acyl-CoA dehydrogenase